MKINNFIFKSIFFNKAIVYENYILLNDRINIQEKYYNTKIMESLKYYGKRILEIVPKTFIKNKQIEEEKRNELLNLFVEFYNNVGYIQFNTDVYNKKNSFVLVTLETIFTLTTNIIKFYMFYELYLLFENSSNDTTIITENMNLLLDDFNIDNYSKIFLLNILNNELKNYEKKANVELNFKFNGCLDNIAIPEFNIISNDLYTLGIYMLADKLFIEDSNKYIQCYKCKDIVIRNNTCQKYCSTCSKKVNYGENTNKNKLKVIEELNKYKNKVHFTRKHERLVFDYYCGLINSGNTRKLLNTKKRDLMDFLETVKDQYKREHSQQ